MRALLTFLGSDFFSRRLVTSKSSSKWWLTFSLVVLAISLHSIRATAEQASYREFVSGQPANAQDYNDNLDYVESSIASIDNEGPSIDEVSREFDPSTGLFKIQLKVSDPSGLAKIKTELEVSEMSTEEFVLRASEGYYQLYKERLFPKSPTDLSLSFSIPASFAKDGSQRDCGDSYFLCLYFLGWSSGLLIGEPTAVFYDSRGNSSQINFEIPNLEEVLALPLVAGWYRIEPPFQITPVIPASVVVDAFNSKCVQFTGSPGSYEYRLARLTMQHRPMDLGSTEVNRAFFTISFSMAPEKDNLGDGSLSDSLSFRFEHFSQLVGNSEIESEVWGMTSWGVTGSGTEEFSGRITSLNSVPRLHFSRTCTWNGETYVQDHEGDLIYEGPCEDGIICESTRWFENGP
jgi:hypothetical protein